MPAKRRNSCSLERRPCDSWHPSPNAGAGIGTRTAAGHMIAGGPKRPRDIHS